MDKETNDPLGSDITVTDLGSGNVIADMKSDDQTGRYYVVLQPGGKYSITASKEGYLFYSDIFNIPNTDKGYEKTKDIYLSPNSSTKKNNRDSLGILNDP